MCSSDLHVHPDERVAQVARIFGGIGPARRDAGLTQQPVHRLVWKPVDGSRGNPLGHPIQQGTPELPQRRRVGPNLQAVPHRQGAGGAEVRLADEHGAEVDEGDPGEVWVRGPSVFRGYWPDGAGGPDAEGWFHSGDVAYSDDDGDLHLVDRRREVILVNGFNVYPREIELVIDDCPGVAEAAVVGVPDDATGEAVTAVVVARPGASISVEQVAEHCAERLARFKCPTSIRIVEALPHSATGKVAKGRLRDVYGDDGYGS